MPTCDVLSNFWRALALGNAGATLSLERLNVLLLAAPSQDELAMLSGFSGAPADLTPPEQFLLTLAGKAWLFAQRVPVLLPLRIILLGGFIATV